MKEWCDLIPDWNHLSIKLWHSLFLSWFRSHWISSFIMHSSILDFIRCSSSKEFHDSLVSLTDWQEESKEPWKYSCGGGEIDKFLNAFKIYSSLEENIPAVARIRGSSWKENFQTVNYANWLILPVLLTN